MCATSRAYIRLLLSVRGVGGLVHSQVCPVSPALGTVLSLVREWRRPQLASPASSLGYRRLLPTPGLSAIPGAVRVLIRSLALADEQPINLVQQ